MEGLITAFLLPAKDLRAEQAVKQRVRARRARQRVEPSLLPAHRRACCRQAVRSAAGCSLTFLSPHLRPHPPKLCHGIWAPTPMPPAVLAETPWRRRLAPPHAKL